MRWWLTASVALLAVITVIAVMLWWVGAMGALAQHAADDHPCEGAASSRASGQDTPTGSTSMPAPPALAPLGSGVVLLRPGVGDLEGPLLNDHPQTMDGAVAAFAESAEWVLASPAAARDPRGAVTSMSEVLNVADREMLVRVDRTAIRLRVGDGAYRTVGHSGESRRPALVMIEVLTPMQSAGRERWLTLGGVVSWTSGRWQASSMQPRELARQPERSVPLRAMSAVEQAAFVEGLGWRLFPAG